MSLKRTSNQRLQGQNDDEKQAIKHQRTRPTNGNQRSSICDYIVCSYAYQIIKVSSPPPASPAAAVSVPSIELPTPYNPLLVPILQDDSDEEMDSFVANYSQFFPDNTPLDSLLLEEDDEQEEEEEEEEEEESPFSLNAATFADERSELFGADIDEITGIGRRRRQKKKRSKSKLSPEMAATMGEANMLYASKDFAQAVPLLMEVVRQAPNVVDPYYTLGLIHEELGDQQKALEFFMIAAHLTPRDSSLWKRLALLSRELGQPKQAIYCFTKAIREDPDDVDAIWDRSIIYSEINQFKKAIEGFELLKNKLHDADVSKEIARCYYEMGQKEKAIETLEKCFSSSKELDFNLLNILVELYMGIGEFDSAILLINKINLTSTESLPMEFVVNMGICEIYIGNATMAEIHLNKLFQENVTIYGDLYYNVAETYMAVAEYDKALTVFENLLSNPDYDKPAIWIKQARCHQALKHLPEATECYAKVLKEVPDNVEAGLALAELYKEQNDPANAIAVLEHQLSLVGTDYKTGAVDLRLLVQKAFLHFSLGQYNEFLETCLPIVQDADLRPAAEPGRKRKRSKRKDDTEVDPESNNLLRFSKSRKNKEPPAPPDPEPLTEPAPSIVDLLGVDDYMNLIIQCCKVLSYFERYEEAGKIIHDVMPYISSRLKPFEKEKLNQIRFLAVGIAFNNADYTTAYESVRYVCSRRPYNISLWNLFNKIVTKLGSFTSHQKFVMRLLAKNPQSIPLQIITGHYSSLAGSFRLALREYFKAYKLVPDDPMLNLCIGVAYLSQIMNRKLADRHYCTAQAFTFLFKYVRLSSQNEESNYNLGRAFHQLGLVHLAQPFYEKVLLKGSVLKREAAYNLSLIYRASGSPQLAIKVLQEYCVI